MSSRTTLVAVADHALFHVVLDVTAHLRPVVCFHFPFPQLLHDPRNRDKRVTHARAHHSPQRAVDSPSSPLQGARLLPSRA